MKKFETVKQQQQDLKEKVIYLKEIRGINYMYWVNKLGINKGTMSGWIGEWRNLPKEIERKLRQAIEEYKEG